MRLVRWLRLQFGQQPLVQYQLLWYRTCRRRLAAKGHQSILGPRPKLRADAETRQWLPADVSGQTTRSYSCARYE